MTQSEKFNYLSDLFNDRPKKELAADEESVVHQASLVVEDLLKDIGVIPDQQSEEGRAAIEQLIEAKRVLSEALIDEFTAAIDEAYPQGKEKNNGST